jgi:hypothetical protein
MTDFFIVLFAALSMMAVLALVGILAAKGIGEMK